MTDFTPEQEAEIAKRVEQARAEQAAMEQFRIVSDQFFRESLTNIVQKVSAGLYDEYMIEVAKAHYAAFKSQYFPQQGKQPEPSPEPEKKGDGDETDSD